MRHISHFIAAALPCIALGAPTYQFDLTGDQFAAALEHRPATEQEYRARDRAYSYFDGAKDATIGKLWCPARPHVTAELAHDAADYIRGLDADLRKGNAAVLLQSYLSSRYPCGGQQ
jgi:hypothetical protein